MSIVFKLRNHFDNRYGKLPERLSEKVEDHLIQPLSDIKSYLINDVYGRLNKRERRRHFNIFDERVRTGRLPLSNQISIENPQVYSSNPKLAIVEREVDNFHRLLLSYSLDTTLAKVKKMSNIDILEDSMIMHTFYLEPVYYG